MKRFMTKTSLAVGALVFTGMAFAADCCCGGCSCIDCCLACFGCC